MAENPINTVRKRRNLQPRAKPYWYKFRRGAALGFYVGSTGVTSWRARARMPDDSLSYTVLGAGDELSYEDALKQARIFADRIRHNSRPDYTVQDAITDYIADYRARKGKAAATDAEKRLFNHVREPLLSLRLTALKSTHIKAWLSSLVTDGGQTKSGANRLLSSFKAALNLAFRSGFVETDGEWRRVPAFKNADQARILFLTPKQVQALIDASEDGFRDLVQAAVHTGARYGELTAAKVSDFDQFGGTLELSGKTGHRTCYLSDDAVAFFRKLAKDRLPSAFLLARDDGLPWGRSHQHRPMQRAVAAAGLPGETVFYSLRHYHISRALLAGVAPQVIAENCGTSIRMIEKHYGKFTRTDRRQMLNAVSL